MRGEAWMESGRQRKRGKERDEREVDERRQEYDRARNE